MERKPYAIVCVESYEFEGRKFVVGEIGEQSFGRNVPVHWRKATREDVEKWINRK